MVNYVFKKEENLIFEKDFKEIEITTAISANTHKSIARNSMIKKMVDGEAVETFSREDYQLNMVSSCCLFDGKKLSPIEVSRFEKEFLTKVFLLLTPESQDDSQSVENSED